MKESLGLFEPVHEGDISQSIARQIKSLMRKGKLANGDRLPGERELTRELGVSRATLREAFHSLEATGFVRVVPGKGTYIQNPSASDSSAFESVMWPWLHGGEKAIAELFEVRILLEVEAAGLAAERATPPGIEAIADALEEMKDAVGSRDVYEMAKADLGFHRSIFVACGNALLLTLIDAIASPLSETRVAAFQMSGGLPQTIHNHVVLLDVIKSGDGALARKAMFDHLSATRRLMMLFYARLIESAPSES